MGIDYYCWASNQQDWYQCLYYFTPVETSRAYFPCTVQWGCLYISYPKVQIRYVFPDEHCATHTQK